ncbi:MAG: CoA transferase [Sphingomonas bacterium]|nr:CoA transferase [Sphingomonas bacterium]
MNERSGPLNGLRILEFSSPGPVTFCGMMMSDMGADVVRVDRAETQGRDITYVMARGRRSIRLDLKNPAAVSACLDLIASADALVEGFRPGVMERLGLGPDAALKRNPRLVYGRATGWGQDGPLSHAAGHDINYIAMTGALHAIGGADRPSPPLHLLGDAGGGGMYVAFGLLAGIIHARATGQGQVVDSAILDGAASLMAMVYSRTANGIWKDERESNFCDGGAHYYRAYQCAEGKWISIASYEPKFYRLLLAATGLDDTDVADRTDRAAWPMLRERLAALIAQKTRAEWCDVMEGTDICFAPILSISEAPEHSHNVARDVFLNVDGVIQPAPAPRFSATPGKIQSPPPEAGAHNREVLTDWGLSERAIDDLLASSAMM